MSKTVGPGFRIRLDYREDSAHMPAPELLAELVEDAMREAEHRIGSSMIDAYGVDPGNFTVVAYFVDEP